MRVVPWRNLLVVMVIGYSLLGRTFAYVGVPQASLFIGELALGAFLLLRARESLGLWLSSLASRSALTGFSWALFVFVSFGFLQVIHGLLEGYPTFTAFRDFAFHYYALYLFLGLWVSRNAPDTLPRLMRLLAWAHGIYGLAYVLFLGRVDWYLPFGFFVSVFGQPSGAALSILGLVAFEKDPRRVIIPYLLNFIVLLGMQIRAEWLGVAVGVTTWMICTGRVRAALRTAVTVLLLLGIGYVTDLKVAVGSRGTASSKEIIGRALAPLSSDLASRFTESEVHAGTVLWRERWWDAIWSSAHETLAGALVGHGYGFPLASLEHHIEEFVRTPHSMFYFALGYTGWLGVAVVILFQATLARLMWKIYRTTREPFGMVYFALAMSLSLFGSFYETPYGAVPAWLLYGLVIGRWLAWRHSTVAAPHIPDRHAPRLTTPTPFGAAIRGGGR